MFDSLYPTMQWAQYANRWPHAACSQFVQAGGIRWHVQTMGSGPCLLLLHGTGSGSFSWRGLMPLLSPHFKIIAPDLPGHAFTSRGPVGSLSLNGMTEGIRALMLQLNLSPAIIAGHSAGAAIAASSSVYADALAPGAVSFTNIVGADVVGTTVAARKLLDILRALPEAGDVVGRMRDLGQPIETGKALGLALGGGADIGGAQAGAQALAHK